MPMTFKYRCTQCDLRFPTGWGGYLYVINDAGERLSCSHPQEGRKIEEVLGRGASRQLVRTRTGFNSHCICLDCMSQFDLDIGDAEKGESWRYFYGATTRRDERKCPDCKSTHVKTVIELVGEPCPKCKLGQIEAKSTGVLC